MSITRQEPIRKKRLIYGKPMRKIIVKIMITKKYNMKMKKKR
jgi:hypothetical protein